MTDDVITLRNHLRVGAQNALRRWQLCEMTGWTDRHLRKVIEAARCEEDGEEYCIMNFGKGYYLSNDPAEAEALRKIEMARIATIIEMARVASVIEKTFGSTKMIRKAGRS